MLGRITGTIGPSGGRTTLALVVALACAVAGHGLLSATLPSAARAEAEQPSATGFGISDAASPGVVAWTTPQYPEGPDGWYASLAHVTLLSEYGATIYYSWDSLSGPWAPYESGLIAPEGKHVLYAGAVDGQGVRGPLIVLPIKVTVAARSADGVLHFPALAASGTFSVLGASVSASGGVQVSASIEPMTGLRMIRVFGSDRYGTSEQISLTNFPIAPTVIVATGENFPDALTSGGLAGSYGAPVLLTRKAHLPAEIAREIRRLGARHTIIIGSAGAVSTTVERELRAITPTVERIGGADRYETAALIAQRVVAMAGGASTHFAFVATGDMFPDSLAVSPFAWHARTPILLVHPTSMPDVTSRYLVSLGITDVAISGGPAAVSDAVKNGIQRLPGMASVERVGGATRYDTAATIADWGAARGFGAYSFLGIARGDLFPDALCGGAAIGKHGGVLLLTPPESLCDVASQHIRDRVSELREIQVYGSDTAVSPTVWHQITVLVS